MPLLCAAAARRPSLPLKRKQVVDSDSDEERKVSPGQENAGGTVSRPASAAVKTEDACPLSPVSKNLAGRPGSPMKGVLTVAAEVEEGAVLQVDLADNSCKVSSGTCKWGTLPTICTLLGLKPVVCLVQMCGGGRDVETLLHCGGCGGAFHCACLEPALAAVPMGSWTCSAACSVSLGSGTAAVKTEPAAAVKPEPGSQRPAAKRRAGRVQQWSSSENDSEDEGRGIKAGEVRGSSGSCITAVQRVLL